MENVRKVEFHKEAKDIKELKELINNEIISGYECKINFDNSRFLIKIGDELVISIELFKEDKNMSYNFIFNVEFISNNLVSYDEINMINSILEILNDNKELITSKFKEYSIEEYDVERQKEDKIAKQIGIAFDKALTRAYNRNIKQEEKARDEIKELAHTIVNITANEIIILEEEINKIIENKSKNERVIDYIFNRMLSLTFVPKDKIEGLYYKLLNYTRKLNVNLAGKYEKEFIEYYNIDNYVFAEEV